MRLKILFCVLLTSGCVTSKGPEAINKDVGMTCSVEDTFDSLSTTMLAFDFHSISGNPQVVEFYEARFNSQAASVLTPSQTEDFVIKYEKEHGGLEGSFVATEQAPIRKFVLVRSASLHDAPALKVCLSKPTKQCFNVQVNDNLIGESCHIEKAGKKEEA